MTIQEHRHLFGEEQEPSGRLILVPCLRCGMSALDGMAQLIAQRDQLKEEARASEARDQPDRPQEGGH